MHVWKVKNGKMPSTVIKERQIAAEEQLPSSRVGRSGEEQDSALGRKMEVEFGARCSR